MKVIKIETEVIEDPYPDLSYLGEFGDKREKYAISRERQKDWKYGEYRYFYPANQPTSNMSRKEKHDAWKQCMKDYKRMQEFIKGHWHIVQVRVIAYVKIGRVIQKIASSGIGGIESDDEDLIEYYSEEEKKELIDILKEMGCEVEV